MDSYIVQGGRKLKGTVSIMGAKNAAGPIIAASTLIRGVVVLHNVPRITDVETMLTILKSMGARISWKSEHTVEIDSTDLDPSKMDQGLISKIRLSILFLGCLAQRFKKVSIPVPGGCNIGSRPLDAHFEALEDLGFHCSLLDDKYVIEHTGTAKRDLVMKEFSVTATENVLLASVLGDHSIRIRCCAAEHVVQDLCWFLKSAGARIDGIGTHTLTIEGVRDLHAVEYTIMPDPIETGTFIALAAATQSEIIITNTAPEFLSMELSKFEEIGVHVDINLEKKSENGQYDLATLKIAKKKELKAIKKLHCMPYPGFAADLIQPFALLMTQAQGISLIHDWMFDGRLRYVSELVKMGANINILDPHRILIVGPTPLYGKEITSVDLRAGATLVVAALIAEGETHIAGINQIERGYERLDERLRSLGASIEHL